MCRSDGGGGVVGAVTVPVTRFLLSLTYLVLLDWH
jgi:hypothetical protein